MIYAVAELCVNTMNAIGMDDYKWPAPAARIRIRATETAMAQEERVPECIKSCLIEVGSIPPFNAMKGKWTMRLQHTGRA